jgi:hypothetical protein
LRQTCQEETSLNDLFYKVRWKNCPKPQSGCDQSWEPWEHLSSSIVSTWNLENAAAYQAALADLERKTTNLKKPVVAHAAIVDNGADLSRFSGRERQPNPKFA